MKNIVLTALGISPSELLLISTAGSYFMGAEARDIDVEVFVTEEAHNQLEYMHTTTYNDKTLHIFVYSVATANHLIATLKRTGPYLVSGLTNEKAEVLGYDMFADETLVDRLKVFFKSAYGLENRGEIRGDERWLHVVPKRIYHAFRIMYFLKNGKLSITPSQLEIMKKAYRQQLSEEEAREVYDFFGCEFLAPVFIEMIDRKQPLRDAREPLLTAFDILKPNILIGIDKVTDQEWQAILAWYQKCLDLDEEAIGNPPALVAKYIQK